MFKPDRLCFGYFLAGVLVTWALYVGGSAGDLVDVRHAQASTVSDPFVGVATGPSGSSGVVALTRDGHLYVTDLSGANPHYWRSLPPGEYIGLSGATGSPIIAMDSSGGTFLIESGGPEPVEPPPPAGTYDSQIGGFHWYQSLIVEEDGDVWQGFGTPTLIANLYSGPVDVSEDSMSGLKGKFADLD